MDNRTTLPTSLDANAFARVSPLIEEELRRRAFAAHRGGAVAPSSMKDAMHDAFTHLFGVGRTRLEKACYMIIAARLLRCLAIDHLRSGGRIGDMRVDAAELERWTVRLEAFNPLGLRMVDLHYFAGCTVLETATVLSISPRTVIGDLRFARERLRTRLDWLARNGGQPDQEQA